MATTFVVLNFFLHCFYELNPVILLLLSMTDLFSYLLPYPAVFTTLY